MTAPPGHRHRQVLAPPGRHRRFRCSRIRLGWPFLSEVLLSWAGVGAPATSTRLRTVLRRWDDTERAALPNANQHRTGRNAPNHNGSGSRNDSTWLNTPLPPLLLSFFEHSNKHHVSVVKYKTFRNTSQIARRSAVGPFRSGQTEKTGNKKYSQQEDKIGACISRFLSSLSTSS